MDKDNLQPAGNSEVDAIQRVQLARHPERPYTSDYIETLFSNFYELRGDRRFSNDPAIISGFADFRGLPVAIVGQQKGRDTKQRRYRNFGMPKPEGYRKAVRIMQLADKFKRPIISFIDTPGAYPGIDAEERGQAQAIANNLSIMARLSVPIIVVIIGEGGSGGALAIGVGDSVLMLENAIYSVITPEGCAAILWKNSAEAARAAQALKLTAQDLLSLGLIDKVIKESVDNRQLSWEDMIDGLSAMILDSLKAMQALGPEKRITERYRKLRALGY